MSTDRTTLRQRSLIVAILVGSLGVTTPVAADSLSALSPALREEVLSARKAYDGCLIAAARKVDDGKSDAGAIAASLKGECVVQIERAAGALAPAITSPDIDSIHALLIARKAIEDHFLNDAKSAVLKERAAH